MLGHHPLPPCVRRRLPVQITLGLRTEEQELAVGGRFGRGSSLPGGPAAGSDLQRRAVERLGGGQAQDDENRQDQPVRVGPAPGPLPGAQAGDRERGRDSARVARTPGHPDTFPGVRWPQSDKAAGPALPREAG